MGRTTKILIVGESPALPTGGAETLRLLFEGLLRKHPAEYELCQVGLAHCFAVAEPKWPVRPTTSSPGQRGIQCLDATDINGEVTVRESVESFHPDIVFALNVPQRVGHLCRPRNERAHRVVVYLKIDGFPLHDKVGLELNRADLIVTMSEWARQELIASCPGIPGIPPERVQALCCPADTVRFHMVPGHEKGSAREELFPSWLSPAAFVLGWVGRPIWRKQIWLLYKLIQYLRTGEYLLCDACEQITPFDWDPVERRHRSGSEANLESRPDYRFDCCARCGYAKIRKAEPLRDIYLWLHTNEDDPQAAWKLPMLEHQFGVQRNRDLYYTEGCRWMQSALSPEDMPTLYQLWDAFVYLSGGESFGLPAWEAMCSGLPVIYTDFSGHAEYLSAAQAGLPVSGIRQPERKTGIWRMVADLPEAIAAVRNLYFNRDLGRALGANGRAFAQQYSVDIQVGKWHQAFQSLLAT